MNLDKLTTAIRPRTNAEAIDLGFRLTSKYYFACWIPLSLILLMFALPLYLAGRDFNLAWIYLIIWWLKPVWEPISLIVVSQAIFEQPPKIKATLKQWIKQPWLQIVASLSWRRLSVARNFDLAVTHLEHLTGQQRRQRLNSLHNDSISSAFMLAVIGSLVEPLIVVAIVYCSHYLLQFQLVNNNDPIGTHLNVLTFFSYALAISLVAPFFTITGFTLYLNRRTLLEGWDIEIQFKSLAHRLQKLKFMLPLLFIISVSLLFTLTTNEARAEEIITPKQAQQLIVESVSGEDFYQQNKAKMVVQKHPEVKKEDNKFLQNMIDAIADWLTAHFGTNEKAGDFLTSTAEIIRIGLWVVAAALVIYLLWRYHDYIPIWRQLSPKQKAKKEKPPEQLFGLDIRSSALPEDIPSSALALWKNGKCRDALGLLYRGGLSVCVHRFELPFRNFHTEGDCLAIVSNSTPSIAAFFEQLTWNWQQTAYGHTIPAINFEEFCQSWQTHFSGEPHAKPE